MQTHYDVSVHRWPMPWSTRYKVVDHFWNDNETKLTLVTVSGDAISFPRMDRRAVRIYANYRAFKESQEVKTLPAPDPVAEPAQQDVPAPQEAAPETPKEGIA